MPLTSHGRPKRDCAALIATSTLALSHRAPSSHRRLARGQPLASKNLSARCVASATSMSRSLELGSNQLEEVVAVLLRQVLRRRHDDFCSMRSLRQRTVSCRSCRCVEQRQRPATSPFRISCVRLGRSLVYLIVVECGLILPKAQAPRRDHNVRDGPQTPRCNIALSERAAEVIGSESGARESLEASQRTYVDALFAFA